MNEAVKSMQSVSYMQRRSAVYLTFTPEWLTLLYRTFNSRGKEIIFNFLIDRFLERQAMMMFGCTMPTQRKCIELKGCRCVCVMRVSAKIIINKMNRWMAGYCSTTRNNKYFLWNSRKMWYLFRDFHALRKSNLIFHSGQCQMDDTHSNLLRYVGFYNRLCTFIRSFASIYNNIILS